MNRPAGYLKGPALLSPATPLMANPLIRLVVGLSRPRDGTAPRRASPRSARGGLAMAATSAAPYEAG
jgi:hypothetical protein